MTGDVGIMMVNSEEPIDTVSWKLVRAQMPLVPKEWSRTRETFHVIKEASSTLPEPRV